MLILLQNLLALYTTFMVSYILVSSCFDTGIMILVICACASQEPAAFAANCPVPLELKIAMMPKLP
jgi:hypothetical protein